MTHIRLFQKEWISRTIGSSEGSETLELIAVDSGERVVVLSPPEGEPFFFDRPLPFQPFLERDRGFLNDLRLRRIEAASKTKVRKAPRSKGVEVLKEKTQRKGRVKKTILTPAILSTMRTLSLEMRKMMAESLGVELPPELLKENFLEKNFLKKNF